MIPIAEWRKMSVEQQDAIKAQNKSKKKKPKCEFYDKIGYTESECRILKHASYTWPILLKLDQTCM